MIGRIMAMIVLNILIVVVVIVTGSEFSGTRDVEIDRLLKKLNKPFLKSIKVYLICGFTKELHLTNFPPFLLAHNS